MAEATPAQIQQFANERIRPRAEQLRSTLLSMQSDKASIDDVYQAVTGSQSGWTDARTDGPPHLLNASDVTAFNALITNLIAQMLADPNWAKIQSACVRPVQL